MARSKGTLESLILTWEISKKGCESDINSSEKVMNCKTNEQIALALEEIGFCLGANQLKIYDLYYDPVAGKQRKGADNHRKIKDDDGTEYNQKGVLYPSLYKDILILSKNKDL